MGKSKRRSKARRSQAEQAPGQATKTSPTFAGPYLVYRAGAPESLTRMLRRIVSGVGAGALLQSCVMASAQPPTKPDAGQEQPSGGSSPAALRDQATKGQSITERPSARLRIYDAPWDPDCWFDAPHLSRVQEVSFRSDARVRYSGGMLEASCVLACPLPPVEVGEPENTEPGRYGRRTVVDYARLPCEKDEERNLVCRFQKRLLVQSNDNCFQIGRRPRGLGELAPGEQPSETAAWLARAAALEAASVPAFEELARSLEALGAPAALVQDAHRAADDERRHALFVGALASRYGAEPLTSSLTPSQPASREELGLENLIEGCVRETLGAAYALWQARHASDPAVRAVMKTVAKDEARHADLAWRVHSWLGHPRHDDSLAAAIKSLRKDAFSDELVTTLGLPPRAAQLALLATVEEALWRPEASRAA